MSYYSSGYRGGGGNPFGITMTPWVKRLLIANVAVFVIVTIVSLVPPRFPLVSYLAFSPTRLLLQPWSVITYMFTHEQIFHLLFNMLAVFFFGPPLEERWGSREFLKFYLLAGIGGALLSLVFPWPIIGASAAVYGIMVAYAMYWPDNPIYFFGIFPVKAKWLVLGLIGLNVFFAITGGQAGVAHLAHLGGAAAAFLYLKSPWAPSAWGATTRPKKAGAAGGLTGLLRRRPAGRAPAETPRRAVAVPKRAPPQRAEKRSPEIDRILDKISAQGIAALTDEELDQLKEASKQR